MRLVPRQERQCSEGIYTSIPTPKHALGLIDNLNLHIKTEYVTAGADATVYVWFLYWIFVHKRHTLLILLHPTDTDSDFEIDPCVRVLEIGRNVLKSLGDQQLLKDNLMANRILKRQNT